METIKVKVGTRIHGKDFDAVVILMSLDNYYCAFSNTDYKDDKQRWTDICCVETVLMNVLDGTWTID